MFKEDLYLVCYEVSLLNLLKLITLLRPDKKQNTNQNCQEIRRNNLITTAFYTQVLISSKGDIFKRVSENLKYFSHSKYWPSLIL